MKFPECDIVISPKDLSDYAIFGMNNIDDIFVLGYSSTIEIIKENQSFFNNKS